MPDSRRSLDVKRTNQLKTLEMNVGTALGVILGYIGGFLSKAVFEVWRERRSTPTIETYGFYFDGFPKAIQKLICGKLLPDEAWSELPEDKRYIYQNLRCYVLFLRNTGAAPARDLKVKAHAKDDSGIGFHHFNVEKLIVCDRLSTETDEDKSVTATWKYLNPGDFLEFYVIATGTHKPLISQLTLTARAFQFGRRSLWTRLSS